MAEGSESRFFSVSALLLNYIWAAINQTNTNHIAMFEAYILIVKIPVLGNFVQKKLFRDLLFSHMYGRDTEKRPLFKRKNCLIRNV